ncbi:MAG: hypothetical protein U5L96_14160 [Owenweeksia sp.]|nr:hypothetical protein [Owenweeksia sp.]
MPAEVLEAGPVPSPVSSNNVNGTTKSAASKNVGAAPQEHLYTFNIGFLYRQIHQVVASLRNLRNRTPIRTQYQHLLKENHRERSGQFGCQKSHAAWRLIPMAKSSNSRDALHWGISYFITLQKTTTSRWASGRLAAKREAETNTGVQHILIYRE